MGTFSTYRQFQVHRTSFGEISNMIVRLKKKIKRSNFSKRCRSILKSLERNGHNITALSPDVEKSTPTLTYLHLEKMYSYIYNESGTETDLFKLGEMTQFEVLKVYIEIFVAACVGSMDSIGYKQLLSYPNDFKVFSEKINE